MTWTALLADKTAITIITNFNDKDEARKKAIFEAARRNTRVIAIVKGNCENNTFFL